MRVYKICKIILIILLILIASLSVYLSVRGSAIVAQICSTEINARINDVINRSNEIVIGLDVFYTDYFTIVYDEAKKVSTVTANTGLINQMTLIWNTEIQNGLNELREYTLTFPIGVLTGSALLSNYGRVISVHAHTVSNCAITYKSQFTKAGINQTVHRLTLYTEVTSAITVPSGVNDVVVSQEILLAETVINGDVPESYLLGDESLQYLDLLP